MVKFFCAIIGVAGSAFPVDIDASLSVGDLKNAIKGKNDDIKCTARELQLFLAKKEKGAGAWLTEDEAAAVSLDEGGHLQGFKMMKSSLYLKNPKHFGSNFQSDEDQVHVLVVVPDQAQPQTGLWLVTASVENALNTKGIRCRLYRLMASYLGYYDPVRRTGDKDTALWYEDKTLCIHSIFKSEENALLFDNVLQDECITQTSPLDGHDVSTNVAPVSRQLSELRRIYSRHYAPQDTESPQVSMLSISTNTSIVDVMTDEFKYQRIESEEWFGDVGKAQSCHLMSRDHCRKCPSDRKYDNDPNNRLALSSAMHDWYDGRMYNVPVMNISVESVSERPVIGNRYKVNLIVRALNARYAKWISLILKEGFVASEDSLEMHTCVYVQNPKVFCVCMEWKRKEIDKQWKSYYDMEPAVD